MSIKDDLRNPFNHDANDIRYAIERNLAMAMYAIDKEVIDGRMVATDLNQISRLTKLAVSAGLSGQRINRHQLVSMDKKKEKKT